MTMTHPLSRREEAMVEAWAHALRLHYEQATRQGFVGELLFRVTLGEHQPGLSIARRATIKRTDEVEVRVSA